LLKKYFFHLAIIVIFNTSFNIIDEKENRYNLLNKAIVAKNYAMASKRFNEYYNLYGVENRILVLHKTWLKQVLKTYLDSSLIKNRQLKWKNPPNEKNCFEGKLDTTEYLMFEKSLNLARLLAGVAPINDVDADYSKQCQKAAYCMHLNKDISHQIPKTWKCYSASAALAAQNSNLTFGYQSQKAILGLLKDEEDYNKHAGHRRWLLNPSLTFPGYGSTESTVVIWVIGEHANFRKSYQDLNYFNAHFVTWPAMGYHPYLFATNRFSISLADAFFEKASVKVAVNGASIPIKQYKVNTGYGSNTLVFDILNPVKINVTYVISVGNVKSADGKIKAINYSTTFID